MIPHKLFLSSKPIQTKTNPTQIYTECDTITNKLRTELDVILIVKIYSYLYFHFEAVLYKKENNTNNIKNDLNCFNLINANNKK